MLLTRAVEVGGAAALAERVREEEGMLEEEKGMSMIRN